MIKQINKTEDEPSPVYPKLMKGVSSGSIYLMTSKGCGTRIVAGYRGHTVGYVGDDWSMDNLKDYNEPLTLQNEVE